MPTGGVCTTQKHSMERSRGHGGTWAQGEKVGTPEDMVEGRTEGAKGLERVRGQALENSGLGKVQAR